MYRSFQLANSHLDHVWIPIDNSYLLIVISFGSKHVHLIK